MNTLLSQAANLRAQAHTLAEQALFGDLFASTSTETIDQLNAQADELEAQAAAPAPAPALAVNDDVEVEPSPAEQLNAIFADLLSPVSEPVGEVPAHDDDELLSQWRDANRAGEGRAFGDPDDLTCEADVYEAAELEGARVVCALNTPDCYLVSWSDDYYVVCDCNGWWACRVSL
jgi:hypothetical protein